MIRRCKVCGKDITAGEAVRARRGLCQQCDYYFSVCKRPIYPLPPRGNMHYDPEGRPICHICGKSFERLGRHIVLTHGMTAREYRVRFRLPISRNALSFGRKKEGARKVGTIRYTRFELPERAFKRPVGKGLPDCIGEEVNDVQRANKPPSDED